MRGGSPAKYQHISKATMSYGGRGGWSRLNISREQKRAARMRRRKGRCVVLSARCFALGIKRRIGVKCVPLFCLYVRLSLSFFRRVHIYPNENWHQQMTKLQVACKLGCTRQTNQPLPVLTVPHRTDSIWPVIKRGRASASSFQINVQIPHWKSLLYFSHVFFIYLSQCNGPEQLLICWVSIMTFHRLDITSS